LFEKVVLKAGEQKEVSLKVKVKDLAFYDEKNTNWKVEPGEFIFHLGTSSKAISNAVSVQVK
jgi:beta-glucosidase